MEYIIVAIVGYAVIMAVKLGAKQPVKQITKKRHSGGNVIPVNVNGHKVRTITVKAHTRIVGA